MLGWMENTKVMTETRNEADGSQTMNAQEIAWYYLDGRAARIFRPGERIRAGDRLGAFGGREVVFRESEGAIVSIQYDVWRDHVILGIALAPAVRPEPLVRVGRA
jgi:hypothetical protein